MVARMPSVTQSAATYLVEGVSVRKTDLIPETDTGGLSFVAADLDLLSTLGGAVRQGRWLDSATERLPTVVLGATTARRLGIDRLGEPINIWIGDQWYGVAGILDPLPLAPELDEATFVGVPMAQSTMDKPLHPTTIFVRADPDAIAQTRDSLGSAANPENPAETRVSRPSDALAAQIAAEGAFTSLFLGLGGVALLVGGVGIANVMVISVLERRREIGLRRALGATRTDVASQFLIEALLLAGVGGGAGALAGTALVTIFALLRQWAVVIPPAAVVLAVAATLVIGTVAGLYPSVKAARLAPTEALRTS
jgi:putative ABC transport system permease protein